jgi:DNA repair photolyase
MDSQRQEHLPTKWLPGSSKEMRQAKDLERLSDSVGSESAQVAIDAERRRGRGALSNASGRFEAQSREAVDDGWNGLAGLEALRTEVRIEAARSIITTNRSPDISFDQSINPYRGCEHGCVYCYARPSHCYLGHSAGLDFETQLYAKTNAAGLLETELAAPGYQPKTIALGTNTDPYQPIERRHEITRQILGVLERTRHPVGIVTKSALVTRDIDILGRMARDGLAKVALSVTTLDRDLARRMEPRAATPDRRLEAIRQLRAAGIPTAVIVAPIIPSLTDAELDGILEAARDAGASEAGYVLLRLPLEIKDLFAEWLEDNVPDRARRVMTILRSMRDGKDYDSRWHTRQKGTGPYAHLIAQRFQLALKRLGLNQRRERLRSDLFEPPILPGQQMRLL